MATERVFLRIEYRKEELDLKNQSRIVKYEFTPELSIVYCDEKPFLTSTDIVEAKKYMDKDSNNYDVKIKFTEKALNKLNLLCKQKQTPRLVLFIKEIPFYRIALRGPFKKKEIIMIGGCDKKEAELLVANLNAV